MSLEVLPTWTKGVPCYFKSNNFNQVLRSNNNNTQDSIPDFNVSSSSVHATPSKKARSDNDTTDIDKDICSKCHIRYTTEEDVATNSAWINCKRSCNWWVHTCCVWIHYKNTEKGEKKNRWLGKALLLLPKTSQKPRQLDGIKFNKKSCWKTAK